MREDITDRHALLARSESIAREIAELSASDPISTDMRRHLAELKIQLEELRARLQAADSSRPYDPAASSS